MNSMDIKQFPIELLIPYENNAKIHDDKQIENVALSIQRFGWRQPVVIDRNNVVVIGHCRLMAAKRLGLTNIPVVVADDLTDDEINALRIIDNKTNESAWDEELLALELGNVDLGEFDFSFAIDEFGDVDFDGRYNKENQNNPSLADRYLMPPFSVLDCRSGKWQERKRKWISLGISSGAGRDDGLLGNGGLEQLARSSMKNTSLTGTSVFDPVLTELMYYWFNVPGGSIFDPFAGGSVRGVVATKLGYQYTGIDLSQKQIDENIKQAFDIGVNPKYICDDSLNADKHVQDESVDMVFSCPPYADLEVYSDDPRDISNMDYPEFKKTYREIISKACCKLKPDRFAVFVVGDVRDKYGAYRNFVKDTQDAFTDCGLMYYNEIILITQFATGTLRAARQFNSGRKVIKTHQNVLVFYKGDPKNIKQNYPAVEVDESMIQEIESNSDLVTE